MADLYLWLKAAHIIAVIAWMAGLLYLPRLFVYHCEVERGSREARRFKVMERRLLRYIMTPAMIVSWGLGLALIWVAGVFDSGFGWFWAKLVAVLVLSAVHGLFAVHTRQFAADRNERPARYFRIINEVPTLLMIAIVILAVVKPF